MSSPETASTSVSWRTPAVVITAGCLIAIIGFGVRSSFGLFQVPILESTGWSRGTFGMAMGIQNLLWGLGLPVAGYIADKFGPMRVMAGGAVIYCLGVFGMAEAQGETALYIFGGIVTGLGVAFTAFSIAMAAMARVVGPERRSLALGLGTAAGSFGQVVFSPLGGYMINAYGWQSALYILAGISMLIIPLAFALPNETTGKGEIESDQSLLDALSEAGTNKGFVLLTFGFFVCGFHVAFITVHFPAYISDLGMGVEVGVIGLMLIGVFNIVGSVASGAAGQRWSKAKSLSWIYLLRSLVILGLLLLPKNEVTIYTFSAAMGLLWLSTVPLTAGIVAQIFGLRYMATLFGIVFLSHQLGSFLGIWLGGRLFDTTGSYDVVWWAGVALGIGAAIVHWPINEKPLARLSLTQ
jgi:predicted MFS family arabinose efflux permease